jgi:hypothetical protein
MLSLEALNLLDLCWFILALGAYNEILSLRDKEKKKKKISSPHHQWPCKGAYEA